MEGPLQLVATLGGLVGRALAARVPSVVWALRAYVFLVILVAFIYLVLVVGADGLLL